MALRTEYLTVCGVKRIQRPGEKVADAARPELSYTHH